MAAVTTMERTASAGGPPMPERKWVDVGGIRTGYH